MYFAQTAGRYLQAIGSSKGLPANALAYVQARGDWNDREEIIASIKMTGSLNTGNTDIGSRQNNPVSEAFADVVRPYSIPEQLALRHVPMNVRILINGTTIAAQAVDEHSNFPVLKGDWSKTVLRPRDHGGLIVQDMTLLESMTDLATSAFQTDLARAVANAENESFVSPSVAGSVFDGQTNFNTSGSSLSQIDADLKQLFASVEGAFLPGSRLVMKQETGTYLGLLRGTGGAPAFPNIGPKGGSLLGVPVLITSAAHAGSDNVVGLVDPTAVFYAEVGYELSSSQSALLLMDNPPTSTRSSMFQENAVALKGVKTSNWYARPGAGAYVTVGY